MLWLYGAQGSGKTHLLQATVAEFVPAQPANSSFEVGYFPARQIRAVDAGDALGGSERYALLCIDDVDSWLGVAAVEQELVRRYQERRTSRLARPPWWYLTGHRGREAQKCFASPSCLTTISSRF